MGLFKKKSVQSETIVAPEAEPLAGFADKASADGEQTAVIMAAIAAYEAEQFRQTLSIRKLSRVSGVRPVWGEKGTHEAHDMRRM